MIFLIQSVGHILKKWLNGKKKIQEFLLTISQKEKHYCQCFFGYIYNYSHVVTFEPADFILNGKNESKLANRRTGC